MNGIEREPCAGVQAALRRDVVSTGVRSCTHFGFNFSVGSLCSSARVYAHVFARYLCGKHVLHNGVALLVIVNS